MTSKYFRHLLDVLNARYVCVWCVRACGRKRERER